MRCSAAIRGPTASSRTGRRWSALVRYLDEQGVIAKAPRVDDLFVPVRRPGIEASIVMRWRVWTDRLIVLVVLIGAWQAGSALARQLLAELAVGDGDALRRLAVQRRARLPRRLHDHRGAGRLRHRRRAGGAAAVPAAPASDRGRDPRSVHGRRLWRAQARLRAAVHPVVRHRHRIQDRAGGRGGVLHRLFQHALGRARARRQARADGAGGRRQASARSAATSCFPARCRRSSPAFASPCPTPSAAR